MDGRKVSIQGKPRQEGLFLQSHSQSLCGMYSRFPSWPHPLGPSPDPVVYLLHPALLGDGAETHPHPTNTSQLCWLHLYLPFPSLVAQRVKNLPAMQETWVQSLGQEDPLEKGMATHSNILAWRIPWIEDPGGLQSMGSQSIGHN